MTGFGRTRARIAITLACAFVFVALPATAQEYLPVSDPGPTDRLLARLDTDEIEPGVLRVLGDGYRELSPDLSDTRVYEYWSQFVRTHQHRYLEAAPDGSVWVLEDGGFFSIGEPDTYDLAHQPRVWGSDDIEVAPDGTLWRMARPHLRSFDGDGWRRFRQKQQFCGVEVQPDGKVWAIWGPKPGTGNGSCIIDTLGRWDGDRFRPFNTPKWRESYDIQLAATKNGEVWLCCQNRSSADQQRLVRFTKRRFEVFDDPAPWAGRPDAPVLIDGSPDGTLWMRRSSTTLVRRDDKGWTFFTAIGDAVPPMGWVEGGGFLRAGPDGSVWVTTSMPSQSNDAAHACDGIAHFDGATWSRYLPGICIYAIDISPDGTAWLQAADVGADVLNDVQAGRPMQPIQTYVIRTADLDRQ